MSNKPTVSVIIPAYNSADYLKQTVESALAQDGAHQEFKLEVIVVDDGSSDDTERLMTEFGSKVRYKQIANSGRPSVPRNIGASLATGEYLAFLDADDVWLPNKLKTQLAEFAEDPSLALVSSNARRIDESGKETGGLVVVDELLPKKIDIVGLIQLNFICTSATMVKTEVFRKLGGFNESLQLRAVEDYELWMRLAATHSIAYNHQALVLYRVHDAATSKHDDREGWQLTLSAYTSFKHAAGRSLNRQAAMTLAEQMLNAHHDLVKLSRPLGKLRHGAAYLYLFIWLRIEYLKNK